MENRNGLRLTLVTAVAALLLLCVPDVAFARGGGGGRASSGTSRVGPAGRGSVGRTRTRASGRGDIIRDDESGGDQSRSSADSRREREAERARKAGEKPGEKPAQQPVRWPRRRGGQSYTVVEFQELSCGKSERVDGVTYFYCDGAWYEKVLEAGEVRWVEVSRPGD